jgi:hypothetical protein
MPKRARLTSGFFCPVFGRSDIRMSGTGIRLNPNTARGSVFGGLLYVLDNFYDLQFLTFSKKFQK